MQQQTVNMWKAEKQSEVEIYFHVSKKKLSGSWEKKDEKKLNVLKVPI